MRRGKANEGARLRSLELEIARLKGIIDTLTARPPQVIYLSSPTPAPFTETRPWWSPNPTITWGTRPSTTGSYTAPPVVTTSSVANGNMTNGEWTWIREVPPVESFNCPSVFSVEPS